MVGGGLDLVGLKVTGEGGGIHVKQLIGPGQEFIAGVAGQSLKKWLNFELGQF